MMIQAITIVITVFYVFINTITDLVYMVVDPRIRKTN